MQKNVLCIDFSKKTGLEIKERLKGLPVKIVNAQSGEEVIKAMDSFVFAAYICVFNSKDAGELEYIEKIVNSESYFGKPDFDKTFQNSPENAFRIALMHQPDYLPEREGLEYDLALSGHSHNGQVTFFGKPIMTVYEGSRFPYGLYQLEDDKKLIVSSGLGTVGIHARFFAPPEIVVLTLKKKAP